MSHFAVVAPPLHSHLQAMQALAAELVERGHRVTFFAQWDASALLHQEGIGFQPLGLVSHPAGSLAQTLRHAAHPNGLAIRRIIADMARTTDMLCRELPDALRDLNIDAVLCDQMEPAGALVAEAMALPFISVACALPINREAGLPLPVMPFRFETGERAQRTYEASARVYDWLMRSHNLVIARHALAFGLPPKQGLHDCLSPLAQLSQTVPGFELPRQALPACFHHVGPLRAARPDAAGPWPVEAARPFVFASLGTLQGQRYGLLRRIAKACRRVDAQLLVAHCGGLDAEQARSLQAAGATWVTDFADQRQVLQQAHAVVSHGGLNTVMDAIGQHTPILALPIAFDQPGVAARVEHAGIGLKASRHASVSTLARHLHQLLGSSAFQEPLARLAAELPMAGGVPRAADIIEQALRSRCPVLAEHAA